MQRKYTPILDQLLPGLLLIALGIVILCWRTAFLRLALFLVALVSIVSGAAMFLMILFRRRELGGHRVTASGGLISIAIGTVILFLPDLQVSLLGVLFALYVLINGAAKFVNFVLFAQNKVKGRITDLFDCLLFLTFGILLLFTPQFSMDSILIIIGIYGIILGAFTLLEFVDSMIPRKTKRFLKRQIRISLPVFIVMLVPTRVLRRTNRYLFRDAEESDRPLELTQYKSDEPAEDPDLEVFIHVTEGGSGAMGHCDFCFDGRVISYGNYDETSRKVFGGAGDGVLFYAEKEKYVPFVTRYSKKTLFGYGLRLSEEQKAALRKRLDALTEPLYPWESPYETDLRAGEAMPFDYYPDYASQLHRYVDPRFYKFRSGRFKSYFVLSTNCVQLVDAALSSTGTAILKINGIITPGTYLDYLDDEFLKPGSMVVSRTVYRENPADADRIPQETAVRARYRELTGDGGRKKNRKGA